MPRRNKNAIGSQTAKEKYDFYGKNLLIELQEKQRNKEETEYAWHNAKNQNRE